MGISIIKNIHYVNFHDEIMTYFFFFSSTSYEEVCEIENPTLPHMDLGLADQI